MVARALPSDRPPFTVELGDIPWSYGAISEIIPEAAGDVIRLRMAATKGPVSAVLSLPNGSRFLSEQLDLTPGEGPRDLHFTRPQGGDPVCLIVRDFGEGASRADVLSLETGDLEDLDRLTPGARVAPPVAPDVVEEVYALSAPNIAHADEAMVPVSLGNACETKLQICRALQDRFRSDLSTFAFRLLMRPPDRSRDIFGWDVFDWQSTPMTALLYYFNSNFEGLYEREDLVTDGRVVLNRRTGVEHSHDYEILKEADQPITEALIDFGHPRAKQEFDRMAAAFRDRLSSPGAFLYVLACEDFPTPPIMHRLLQHLGSFSPEHRFHVLVVGFEDEDQDLSAFSAQVTKMYRPRPRPDAARFDWGSDYETWDRALGRFNLQMPILDREAAS